MKDTQILYRELENNDRELSTLPFFVGLSVSLAERERILISVVSISTPTSSEELESVGIFLEKYHGTTVQLLEFSKVLAEFVNESKNH